MQFLATLVPNGTALVISLVSAFVTRLNLYSRLRQSYARLNLYFRLQQTFATRGTARPALPQSFEDAGVQVGAVAEERIVDGKVFPLTLMPTASSLPSSRVSFVREHNEEILQLVHEYGAVLLRGWGSDSAENFSQISAALRLATTDMACSAGPRFEVAKNIFTANEAPPSERIPFHHEMAQVCEAEFVRPWSCTLGGSMSVGVADGAHVVKRSWKTECMLCLPSASLLCLFLSSHADEPPPSCLPMSAE